MEQDKWSRLIVHWINCLAIPNLKIISIQDLDEKTFYLLIDYLDNLKNEGADNDEHNLNTVLLFLKREYPLFNGDETLEELVKEEPVIIASLLLHYSCIKTKDEGVRKAMCQRLNPVDQKAIMFFANSLMKHENITPKILKETMMVLPSTELCSPMSAMSSPGWASPATPPGRKGRRSRRLLHLEAALETERFDRTYLQEELHRKAARMQEMEKQHAFDLSEITRLRGELSACSNVSSLGDNGTPPQKGEDEAKLRRELRGMEQELLTAMGELANIMQDREGIRKKVAEMEKDLTLWRNRAMDFESARETLLAHIDEDKSQISSLKMELTEKNKILEEYRLEHQLNESIECDDDALTLKKGFSLSFNGPSENLGNAVIDVQLKEQINQNHLLTSQIDELKNEVKIAKCTLKTYEKDLLDQSHEIKTLIDEKNDMRFVVQKHEDNLHKLNQDITEKVSQVNIMNLEKSVLEKELENCHNLIQNYKTDAELNMAHLSKLIQNIETLENNHSSLLKENADIQYSVELLNNEKKIIETELRDLKLSHNIEMHEATTKINVLNNTLENIVGEKEELKKNLCMLKDEQEVYKNQLQIQHNEIENLCREKEYLIEEGEALSNNLMTCETNLISHTQIIANVTQENLKNQNIINLKNIDIKSLSAEVQHLKESVTETENKLNLVEDENVINKREMETLSKELEKSESVIEYSKQEMEKDETTIVNLTQENFKLAEINNSTKIQMHQLEEKSAELCNAINKLNEELVEHKIIIATRDREIHTSEDKLSNTEVELTLQLDSIKLLKNELVNLQHSYNLSKLEVQSCKEDCDLKDVKLKIIIASNEELETKIVSKAVEVEELQNRLEVERKNSSELSVENKKITQHNEATESLLSDLKTEMERRTKKNEEEFSEKIKSFTADKCELSSEIDRQKVALSAFQQDAKIKNNELTKMTSQVSDLENDVSLLKEEILHFQDEIKIKDQISYKLKENNISLTEENKKLKTAVDQNKEALISEHEKTELLSLELSNKIKNIEDYDISIKMLTDQKDQLHSSMQSIQTQLQIISKDYEKLLGEKECLSSVESDMKAKIFQYKDEIASYNNKIQLKDNLLDTIENERIDLSKKNEMLTAEMMSLNDKFVLLNDEKLEIQNTNNVLFEKFNNSQKEIVQYKNDIDSFKNIIKITEDLVADLESDKIDLSKKKEIMSAEITSLNEKFVSMIYEKLEIQNSNNILSVNLQNSEQKIAKFLGTVKLTEDLLIDIEGNRAELSEKYDMLTADVVSLKDKVILLNVEKLEIQNINNSLSKNLQDSEKEIVQYRGDIANCLEKMKLTEDLLARIEGEKIALSKENEILSADKISLNDKLDLLNNEKLEILNMNNVLSEKLQTSNVTSEFEESKQINISTNMADVYLQEISQLKLSISDLHIKLKDMESKLTAKENENDALLREKLDLEKCIDSVKLTLVGEGDLDDCKEIQPVAFEDSSLEFECVLLVKNEPASEKPADSGYVKMNSIKSKLTQLCNSTEMISKTCAKTILQKDETILKLTDEYNYLKEHNVVVNSNINQLRQKLYDIEEEILCQKIHYETQIVELETLREAECSKTVELNHTLGILKDELKSAKQEIKVFEHNEKIFFQMLYSKIQLISDFLSSDKEVIVHSDKLKSLEDKLSKIWEVVCEAVKRLKEMSLPIIDEIFPPYVQLPIMKSLKFLNSVNFDNSLSIFDVLATITSSIDYIDNYVDNLCKMIVSLVQDRITCRDSLKSLEKQNNIISKECQNYKRRLESTSREKDNIAKKLSEVELVKEKLEKSLNTSDAISSTTPCTQELNVPSHIVDFIKKFDENISRLRNIVSLQGTHTKNVNILKESLCGLNYTLNDFLGDKIALQNALKSHRNIESNISNIEANRWTIFDRIVNFSADLLSFASKNLQPLRDNSEIDNTVPYNDSWVVNLEEQLGGIEAESIVIQKTISELQATIKNLETEKSSQKDVNSPLNCSVLKPEVSIYEQLYNFVEKYILIKEELSVFEAQKNSEVELLKDSQNKNVEETNELINKISALRKVLKEIESKNNQLAVEKEGLKYHNEQQEVIIITEKDSHRKTMNENIYLKKQVDSLTNKMNDLNVRFMTEANDLRNENKKLALENQKIQAKLAGGGDTDQMVTDMRNEYEDKLTRMKQKMKQLYQDQIAVYTEKQKEEIASLEALCKKYSEKIKKYEDHVNQLMNEQWKIGEKLLNQKKVEDELRKRLREITGSQQSLNSITSTVSLPHTRVDTRRNINDTRRPSRRPLPSPVRERPSFKPPNKVEFGGLHMSDEEGEVFDNTHLPELRSGVSEPRASSTAASRLIYNNENRLSELQWRNSLCQAHLKSSYPTELQYDGSRLREEDIKMGMSTIILDDSIMVDKPRTKKEAGQTSYHKPGPPTPSKNNGRLSLQGNDAREPLKEQSDCNTKKATTPSRIKSLFMGNTSKSSSRDENTFGTPKGRRLSIFRKPR